MDAGAVVPVAEAVVPPAPAPAEPSPRAASIAELLSLGAAASVEVLVEERSGRDMFVMFTQQRDLGEAEAGAEAEGRRKRRRERKRKRTGTTRLVWPTRATLGRQVVRVELARIRERDGVFELLDRVVLTGPVLYARIGEPAPKETPT